MQIYCSCTVCQSYVGRRMDAFSKEVSMGNQVFIHENGVTDFDEVGKPTPEQLRELGKVLTVGEIYRSTQEAIFGQAEKSIQGQIASGERLPPPD